jgi:hypothetical protein
MLKECKKWDGFFIVWNEWKWKERCMFRKCQKYSYIKMIFYIVLNKIENSFKEDKDTHNGGKSWMKMVVRIWGGDGSEGEGCTCRTDFDTQVNIWARMRG